MKQYRSIFILVLVLLTPIATVGTASAAQVSVVQELHVTARVLPMRRVIVDANGQIQQIISNTAEDVTPTVYFGRDTDANKIPLTDDVQQQYQSLVPQGSGKAGILYTRSLITSQSPIKSSVKFDFGTIVSRYR